jgi:hypothetical protein
MKLHRVVTLTCLASAPAFAQPFTDQPPAPAAPTLPPPTPTTDPALGPTPMTAPPAGVADQAAVNPLAMTASKQCDAVRDLVIDTVVHQMIVGYGYYGYGYPYYYRGGLGVPEPAMEKAAAAPAAAGAAAPAAAPAASAAPVMQAPTSGPSRRRTCTSAVSTKRTS